jgi:glycerate 2-kinase
MFGNAKEYIDFLKSVQFDFSAFEFVREKPRKVVISVGKSAGYMYEKFALRYPETAVLPAFAVLPEGIAWSVPENVETFFSSHPHLTEKSFEAAEKLIKFIKKHEPENATILLSGGSSALIEKSLNEKEAIKLNEKLLKSGLPITEINKKRSEYSLIKNGKLAGMFGKTDFYVFVASDIPFDGGEKCVGSMPFFREDLKNTYLFKCADSDLLHDTLLKNLPENTESFRRFTGSVDELKNLVLSRIEAGAEAVLVTGEPLLKIDAKNAGTGGRMSHFALTMLPFLQKGMKLCALSSDGIDGNSPFAGAVVEGGLKTIPENEMSSVLESYNSACLLDKYGLMIKSGYTGLNLNDFVVFLRKNRA